MEAQQTASHKHKNLSWDVQDSWNLFIQPPRASQKCYPTIVSGQHFSASPGRKDLEIKVPGNTGTSSRRLSTPASKRDVAYCEVSTARSWWQQDLSSESVLRPVSKGSPLQKFKIVKWIQDWPLNHTYSSAKEKHVDARKPFRNKYIHITSAPWENMCSFLGPCWTEGNKNHPWKSLRGKNCQVFVHHLRV